MYIKSLKLCNLCTVSEVIRCKEGLLYSVYRSYFFLSLVYISLCLTLSIFFSLKPAGAIFRKKGPSPGGSVYPPVYGPAHLFAVSSAWSQSWRLSIPPCIRPCSPVCGFVCLVPVLEAQYTPLYTALLTCLRFHLPGPSPGGSVEPSFSLPAAGRNSVQKVNTC